MPRSETLAGDLTGGDAWFVDRSDRLSAILSKKDFAGGDSFLFLFVKENGISYIHSLVVIGLLGAS